MGLLLAKSHGERSGLLPTYQIWSPTATFVGSVNSAVVVATTAKRRSRIVHGVLIIVVLPIDGGWKRSRFASRSSHFDWSHAPFAWLAIFGRVPHFIPSSSAESYPRMPHQIIKPFGRERETS
jgi:hypothetical protein